MQCMAQESSEASVASSPPQPPPSASSSTTSSAAAPSWWRDMHPSAYAAWPPPQPPSTVATRWPPLAASHHQHHHRSSSSGAEDDLSASNMTSFTNTSGNHSGLSMDSSVPEAAAVVAESHLWNQVLMYVYPHTHMYIDICIYVCISTHVNINVYCKDLHIRRGGVKRRHASTTLCPNASKAASLCLDSKFYNLTNTFGASLASSISISYSSCLIPC
ncbi:hypothetical protein PR202_gb20764 [Eleusine coracana subsp. coracana]|uniref:Uncharacterized protein n=1 Tax=Eleusine coracana subsp. coracana TaxID=191504 RepID=A0AAV5FBI4_ELECO|nr:hypothetical protein PR202_gb20764 [Eleusine coracana subsp. coracana]